MTQDPVIVDADLTLGEFMDEVVWTRGTRPIRSSRTAGRSACCRSGASPRCLARVGQPSRPRLHAPARSRAELDDDEAPPNALAELSEGIDRGLVLADGRVVGLLSITDLARALEVGGPRPRGRT